MNMAAHIADDKWFYNNVPDTNNMDIWFRVYDEMRNSAYDTSQIMNPDSVFVMGNRFPQDTITIGLMDWDYNRLIDTALTTSHFFEFHDEDNSLEDLEDRPFNPFLVDNIFAVAPLWNKSTWRDITYRIDPDFLFIDQFNSNLYTSTSFEIDFGDGAGWQTIDPYNVSHHYITYPDEGYQIIKARLKNEEEEVIKSSKTMISVQTNALKPPVSSVINNIDDIRASVFEGCSSNEPLKTIIYVEGIDPLDRPQDIVLAGGFTLYKTQNRSAQYIYNQMIRNQELAQLMNFGYNFIVVDWKNSTRDMKKNAMSLVNLIDYLKCSVVDNHQFIIIGESMGGLIARYALAFMESDDYADNDDFGPCEKQKMHNCRLMITLDCPHQGANLPLAYQNLYKHGINLLPTWMLSQSVRLTAWVFNMALDAKAPRQMLKYHVGTESGSGTYKNYSPANAFDNFFDDLDNYGSYPEFCKMVALSSGSLYGGMQSNPYNGNDRTANDYLLDFEGEVEMRVFGNSYTIVEADLELRTNPNGNGNIYWFNVSVHIPTINIYVIGATANFATVNLISHDKYANTEPYCVNPGGVYDVDAFLTPSLTAGGGITSVFFGDMTYVSNGNGLLEAGIDAGAFNAYTNIYTDGMGFGFIPVQSALDYDGSSVNLDHDIESEAVTTTMNRTPFHVVIGLSQDYQNFMGLPDVYNNNWYHNNFRNDEDDLDFLHTCDPPPGGQDYVKSYLVNREIGDEKMYLDNMDLNWEGTFESEFDIEVNSPNPNYEFPSTPPNNNIYGAYSKELPFNINSNGTAHFYHNASNSPWNGFVYNSPITGTYYDYDQALGVCCIDMFNYTNFKTMNIAEKEYGQFEKDYINVYPNPATKNNMDKIWINGKFNEPGPLDIEIINLKGQIVYSEANIDYKEKASIYYPVVVNLKKGLYIIKVTSSSDTHTTKIVIQ